MSAYLDKSQGVTFVFSNIFEIYKKAKEAKIDAPFVAERAPARVIKREEAKVEEFKPEELKTTERTFAVPMGVKEAEEKALRQGARPLANLQKNLSELNDAHDRLKFLLQEIDSLTKKK
jgi:hypothetical protein